MAYGSSPYSGISDQQWQEIMNGATNGVPTNSDGSQLFSNGQWWDNTKNTIASGTGAYGYDYSNFGQQNNFGQDGGYGLFNNGGYGTSQPNGGYGSGLFDPSNYNSSGYGAGGNGAGGGLGLTNGGIYTKGGYANGDSSLPDWLKGAIGNIGGLGGLAAGGLGALLGSQNGSKQTGTQTVTQTPWGGQAPYLLDLFNKSQGQLGQGGVSKDATDALLGSMNNIYNSPLNAQAGGVMSNLLNADPTKAYGIGARNPLGNQSAAQVGNNPYIGQTAPNATNPYIGQNTQLSGNPLLGVNNPYLTQSINNASTDAMRNLQPMFDQQQRASGSFGNAGLAEQQARTAAGTLGNIATNARMGDYQNQQQLYAGQQGMQLQNDQGNINRNSQLAQNQGQFNSSLNQADLSRNASLMNTNLNANAGFQQQQQGQNAQFAQQGIQNDLGQYNNFLSQQNQGAYNIPGVIGSQLTNTSNYLNTLNNQGNAAWNPLKNYGSLITGNYGSSTNSPIYSNPAAGALGGGLLGSQIYKNLNGGG